MVLAASPHEPQGTTLHAFVDTHLEPWLEYRRAIGRPVPDHVEHAFRGFLSCGDPNHSYAVYECPTCNWTRSIAGSCKGRGFCPYCLKVRQRELAEHVIDRVIGNVPVTHWVNGLPPQLRFILGYDDKLMNGGFKSFVAAIADYQRCKAFEVLSLGPLATVFTGSVVGNHRCSATLRVNYHFHGLVPCGVWVLREPGGKLEFCRLPQPTKAEVAEVAFQALRGLCDVLAKRGFWETTASWPDLIEGTLKLPKRRARKVKFFAQAADYAEGGVAPRNGAYAYHLFVGNTIEVVERPQLEQLVNYVLAPPFTSDQVSIDGAGNLGLRLKRNRHDGKSRVTYKPFDAMDRFADLVPRPRSNAWRYYGVYAPRFQHRALVVPAPVLHSGIPVPCRPSTDRFVLADGLSGPLVCPTCIQPLRRVAVLKGKSRSPSPEWTAPDTPAGNAQRIQDNKGRMTLDPDQGRLFESNTAN
jgi:hypothetical protein